MPKRGFLLLSSFILFSLITHGQYGSFGLTDARQLGLGNTFVTNSRGLYAAGKNPALLAYQVSDRKLEVLFPNLSLRQYNVVKVTKLLDDFFSQNKVDIITGINGSLIKDALNNSGDLYLGIQIGFLGVAFTPNEKIGSFSFVMKDFLDGYLHLPSAIVNHLNSGKISLSSVYLNDFNFETTWKRAYELTYGKSLFIDRIDGIKALYAGIGIKYIQGFLYDKISFSAGAGYIAENGTLFGSYKAAATSAFSDDFHTENLFNGDQVISHVPFMDPVGNGMGVDVGLALQSERGVNVGISLTDLGFVNWNGKTKKTQVNGLIRIDSTLSLEDIDSLAKFVNVDNISENQFQTHPTTALHLGLCFKMEKFIRNFPGEMGLAMEFHQGLSKDLLNPEFPRLAAGLDWKAGKWWPVLLTGISTSLNEQFSWSLGIGYELNFLELYISIPNMPPIIEGKGINTVSLSMCWHLIRDKNKIK